MLYDVVSEIKQLITKKKIWFDMKKKKKKKKKKKLYFAITAHTWYQLYLSKILCDHCLHGLHFYSRKMLTNREMVIFQKWVFFRFFFILLL